MRGAVVRFRMSVAWVPVPQGLDAEGRAIGAESVGEHGRQTHEASRCDAVVSGPSPGTPCQAFMRRRVATKRWRFR